MLSGKQRGAWKHPAEATLLGYRPGQGNHKQWYRGQTAVMLETGAKFLPPLAWHVRMCKHSKKSSNAVASSAFLNPLITKLFRSVLNG